jgi:hypothetical protein
MNRTADLELHTTNLPDTFATVDFVSSLVSDNQYIVGTTYTKPSTVFKVVKSTMAVMSMQTLTVDNALFVHYGKEGELVVGAAGSPPKIATIDGAGLKRDCEWATTLDSDWSVCDDTTCLQTATRKVHIEAANGGSQCSAGNMIEKRRCVAGACLARSSDTFCGGSNMVYVATGAKTPICTASCETTYMSHDVCKTEKLEPRCTCKAGYVYSMHSKECLLKSQCPPSEQFPPNARSVSQANECGRRVEACTLECCAQSLMSLCAACFVSCCSAGHAIT